MDPLTIASLVVKIGLPAAQHLYDIYQSGAKEVSPEQMIRLGELATYTDEKALLAGGVKIVDGKVVFI
jgi:hypothetical protein